MGEAKNRGTLEERIAKATPKKKKLSKREYHQMLDTMTIQAMARVLAPGKNLYDKLKYPDEELKIIDETRDYYGEFLAGKLLDEENEHN